MTGHLKRLPFPKPLHPLLSQFLPSEPNILAGRAPTLKISSDPRLFKVTPSELHSVSPELSQAIQKKPARSGTRRQRSPAVPRDQRANSSGKLLLTLKTLQLLATLTNIASLTTPMKDSAQTSSVRQLTSGLMPQPEANSRRIVLI